MSIRRDPIYISSEVHRWLRLLAKAESGISVDYAGVTHNVEDRRLTPDEIADQILRQAIREQHPQLADLQKQIAKLEDATIEQLRVDSITQRDNTKSDAQPK